jgi:hypothetical protein
MNKQCQSMTRLIRVKGGKILKGKLCASSSQLSYVVFDNFDFSATRWRTRNLSKVFQHLGRCQKLLMLEFYSVEETQGKIIYKPVPGHLCQPFICMIWIWRLDAEVSSETSVQLCRHTPEDSSFAFMFVVNYHGALVYRNVKQQRVDFVIYWSSDTWKSQFNCSVREVHDMKVTHLNLMRRNMFW